jgi:hypothetical protein
LLGLCRISASRSIAGAALQPIATQGRSYKDQARLPMGRLAGDGRAT